MQRLEVSGAVRPIYGSLGVKRLIYILILLSLRSLGALPRVYFLSDLLITVLCTFLVHFMHATSSSHLLRLDVKWPYGI